MNQNRQEGSTQTLTALEFFAGSGLVAEGIKPYFEVSWANDICPKKGAIYQANHPSTTFVLDDLSNQKGVKLPYACLSWASFPCQDLSLAGSQSGMTGSRSGLVWQWLRVMDEMAHTPPLIVAENVVGLVSSKGGAGYRRLHEALRERGYRVGAVMLDARHWVPQSRPRVFVIAIDETKDVSDYSLEGPSWCHNAGIIRVANGLPDFAWWKIPRPRTRSKGLDQVIELSEVVHTEDVAARNLQLIPEAHLKRLSEAVEQGQRVFPGYRRTRNGTQVLELRFDNIAGCLRTPEGGSSRQLLVIASERGLETRLLTVREAARVMGVRENYRILGSYNEGYKAIGDAVAVPAVRHLAKTLLAPLAKIANHELV